MCNRLYIAAAGAGKTTFLINQACKLIEGHDKCDKNVAMITYTIKNQENIKIKLIERFGYVPSQIRVMGWYTFLLDYCIKPFMGTVIEALYCQSVGLHLVSGVSGTIKKGRKYISSYSALDYEKKFLTPERNFYSDKLSEFAYQCYEKNKTDFISRLSNIFSAFLFDEVQDLSGWDYNLIGVLLKEGTQLFTMCGDLRQKTYSTTDSMKNGKYKGRIDNYLNEEINKGRKKYIEIDEYTLNKSHRFGQEIADFANKITRDKYPPTTPCNCDACVKKQESFKGIKGVYLVKESDIALFISIYDPLVLIWDKNHNERVSKRTYNYGESKGMETDVCMIYPTDSISKFLSSDGGSLEGLALCKFYVAATRARFLVGIKVSDNFKPEKSGLTFWTTKD